MAVVRGSRLSTIAVGDLLEVEVADEDETSAWRPARVISIDASTSMFKVCINGDGDFVEEYAPDDEGTEWRVPCETALATLAESFAEGEHHFRNEWQVHRPPASGDASSSSLPLASIAEASASATIAEASASATTSSPVKLEPDVCGGFIEVEVAADDGGVSWKPAQVTQVLDGGRFVARVNGEDDFNEEYGPEDEGTEWRRVAASDVAGVQAAYEKAERAWRLAQTAPPPAPVDDAADAAKPTAAAEEALSGKKRDLSSTGEGEPPLKNKKTFTCKHCGGRKLGPNSHCKMPCPQGSMEGVKHAVVRDGRQPDARAHSPEPQLPADSDDDEAAGFVDSMGRTLRRRSNESRERALAARSVHAVLAVLH